MAADSDLLMAAAGVAFFYASGSIGMKVSGDDFAYGWELPLALAGVGLVAYGLRSTPRVAGMSAGLMVGYQIFLRRKPSGRVFAGLRAIQDHGGPPPPPPQCPPGTVWEESSGACVDPTEQHLPWPIQPMTGLSWDELTEATPDLKAARQAAKAALHGWTMLPGGSQMVYHGIESFMGDDR